MREIAKYTFMDWIAIISFLLTLLGLILTIISVIKIQKVKDAQKEAQDRYAECKFQSIGASIPELAVHLF